MKSYLFYLILVSGLLGFFFMAKSETEQQKVTEPYESPREIQQENHAEKRRNILKMFYRKSESDLMQMSWSEKVKWLKGMNGFDCDPCAFLMTTKNDLEVPAICKLSADGFVFMRSFDRPQGESIKPSGRYAIQLNGLDWHLVFESKD